MKRLDVEVDQLVLAYLLDCWLFEADVSGTVANANAA